MPTLVRLWNLERILNDAADLQMKTSAAAAERLSFPTPNRSLLTVGCRRSLIFFEASGFLLTDESLGGRSGNVPRCWCSAAHCRGRLCFSITNAKAGLKLHTQELAESTGQTGPRRSQARLRRHLMACTNVGPKTDGSECLLKYENDGKMYRQFNQTITAASTDEVRLTCVSKDPTKPVRCEATITVLKKPPNQE